MVAWWLCIICFVAGFLFAAAIVSGVCIYALKNKEKMGKVMIRQMMKSAHADN